MADSTTNAGTFDRGGRLSIRRATPRGGEPAKAPSIVSVEELRVLYRWLYDMTGNCAPVKAEHAKLLKSVEGLGHALKALTAEQPAPF